MTTATEEPPAQSRNLLQKAALIPGYLRQKQGTPWDRLPRPRDLADPATFLRGERLHHRLLREEYTMTSSRRGRALYRLAQEIDRTGVEGAIVDCGVWNGGSSILMSAAAPLREIWCFDSFEGLPEADQAVDGEDAMQWTGGCLGAEDKLRQGFDRYANPDRLHVVKGWFDDTFPKVAPEIGPVALVHADGDWYDSVLLTLRTFYPLVPSGGYIVLDDYGHWIGAKRATDEFREEVGDHTPMVSVDYAGRYWRKP